MFHVSFVKYTRAGWLNVLDEADLICMLKQILSPPHTAPYRVSPLASYQENETLDSLKKKKKAAMNNGSDGPDMKRASVAVYSRIVCVSCFVKS